MKIKCTRQLLVNIFRINIGLSPFSSIRVETCGKTERTHLIVSSFDAFYFHLEKQHLLILKGTGNTIIRA